MNALSLIALALCLSLLGIQAQVCTSRGTLQGSYCNCYAGTAPDYSQGADNCIMSQTCTSGTADSALVSGYNAPTLLEPVKFANDRVIISFMQPVVQSAWYRRETNIQFYPGASSESVTPGDQACYYPGSMWNKVSMSNCEDVYTFQMPLSSYGTCGFQKAVTPATLTYTTTVKFTYKEVSDTSSTPNVRVLSNLFTINVQLVRQTAITTALNLKLDSTSAATVSAFVVGTSAYDLLSSQTRVVLQTHTSWPYQVGSAITNPPTAGPTVITRPQGTSVSISPDYLTPDNCPQIAGSDCVQQFEIVVSRSNPTLCDFYGNYVVGTQLVCADTDSCTPAVGPNITISLDHINVCAPPVVDTGVSTTQSLLSFGDKELSNTQTDFETGDTSYWTFTIVDPMISIDSVTLNSVVISLVDNPSSPDVVYTAGSAPNSVITNIVQATNVVHPPGTPVVVSFGLTLNRGLLPNTVQTLEPGDSIKSMNLAVVVDVQYHGNKKRSVDAMVSPANNGGAASTAAFVVRSKEFSQAVAAGIVPAKAEPECTGFCVALSFAKRVVGAVGL